MTGGAWARVVGNGSDGNPRWTSIFFATPGSSMQAMSRVFRGGGARADGTQAAWRAASKRMSEGKTPAADWFLPFSMAADAEEGEMPPPSDDFDEKFSDWVDTLAKALKGK